MNLHKFIVLFCITIAALINSRGPFAALGGFPGEWRWVIAIAVSFPLVYFTEWAIAYDVAISSIKRDIHHDQEQIEAKKRNTKNQLIAVRAEAEQMVFNAVLKDYLHQKTKVFVVFATGLLIVEYAATLFYVRFQGETAINEEIKAITEEFQLELYQIQSELKRRGYSMESNQVLSTEKMNSIKPPKWQLKPDSHS